MNDSPSVAFYTLGCKVNQAETDLLAEEFQRAGCSVVGFDERADVYIVNTCTVTHVGDSKSRQVLRQAKRRNPDAVVVATGCYASIVGERLPVEDILVVRNRDKSRLVPIVLHRLAPSDPFPTPHDKPWLQELSPLPVSSNTRPMVKVQDGCDSACSYCIIPRARGRSRSVPVDEVVERVQRLDAAGYKEVVVTGVDLGSYGDHTPDCPDLGGLLRDILSKTAMPRVRVSSVEPGDFNVDWLELWSDPRMCRHLHVPLQAGCDATLERMRRKYTTAEFSEMLDACRAQIPEVCVTTDVIVGFPGETEEEFTQGFEFMRACRFDGMHVFPYSQRPGTAANAHPDQIDPKTKAARGAALRDLAHSGSLAHSARSAGRIRNVLWEDVRAGVWRGLTDDNMRVYAVGESICSGVIDRVRMGSAYTDGVWAEPVEFPIMPLAAVG